MKIIIASDVPMLSSLLKMAIEDSGFEEVRACSCQEELVGTCINSVPDIIIIDFHCPKKEIVRLIEQLLDIDSTTAIIVVYEATNGFGAKVLSAGARAFLQKPFSTYDIIETIRKVRNVF